jgi:hypothetical protein
MITRDGAKMSKNKGNVISPIGYVERYGADTARSYVLFIGPPDQDADWSDEGVEGVHRFLARLWRLGADGAEQNGSSAAGPARAAGGRRPRADAQGALGDRQGHERHGRPLSRSTPPIAAVMELVNEAYRRRDTVNAATLHFATATGRVADLPVRPAHGAEVYELLTGERVWETPWPDADLALLERDVVESSCRSTASCATGSRRRRTPPRAAGVARARAPERGAAPRRHDVARSSSCRAGSSTSSCAEAACRRRGRGSRRRPGLASRPSSRLAEEAGAAVAEAGCGSCAAASAA